MLVRFASWASLLSFCDVLWMPRPIRAARVANSECWPVPDPLIRGLKPTKEISCHQANKRPVGGGRGGGLSANTVCQESCGPFSIAPDEVAPPCHNSASQRIVSITMFSTLIGCRREERLPASQAFL